MGDIIKEYDREVQKMHQQEYRDKNTALKMVSISLVIPEELRDDFLIEAEIARAYHLVKMAQQQDVDVSDTLSRKRPGSRLSSATAYERLKHPAIAGTSLETIYRKIIETHKLMVEAHEKMRIERVNKTGDDIHYAALRNAYAFLLAALSKQAGE